MWTFRYIIHVQNVMTSQLRVFVFNMLVYSKQLAFIKRKKVSIYAFNKNKVFRKENIKKNRKIMNMMS